MSGLVGGLSVVNGKIVKLREWLLICLTMFVKYLWALK